VSDHVLPAALAGERLDRVVALLGDVSRSRAGDLVDGGRVQVNGSVVRARAHRLAEDDRVAFDVPPPAATGIEPDASVTFDVVHVDDEVIVVDKPAGLVVHPGAGHDHGTLVHGLVARHPEVTGVGDPGRPGIVHRLDAGTSGLLVVARTPAAYESLVRQLQAHTVERVYDALAWGCVADDDGVVDAAIGRSSRDPTRMAVRADGKPARTGYRVVTRWGAPEVTRLTCRLETGRTHQIRVHLTAINHPVVGDVRYGGVRPAIALDRPFLHAAQLRFGHPTSGDPIEATSPLPADLRAVLEGLGPGEPR
jgi:23S rRNA pseudouridine1911/1915/1917 synthase